MAETKFKTFEDIDKIMVESTKIESETPSEDDLKLRLGPEISAKILISHMKNIKPTQSGWRVFHRAK